jgi:hypothetical protein
LLAIGLVAGHSGLALAGTLKPPPLGTFSPTGSMNTARSYSTATLLQTGQVLVAGGESTSGGGPLTSAELFNPATGKWTVTGSTTVPHMRGTATLLPNGEVLLAGGTPDIFSCIATAELFNPATGKWKATGSMTAARCDHAAALLPNGQVLVAGGDVGEYTSSNGCLAGDSLASAELFNPSTGTWQATASMNVARTLTGAKLLQNGNVLVAGGDDVANCTDTPLASAELFDASQGRWNFTGSLSNPGSMQIASLLANGDVLALHFAFFNPATGTWTNTGSFPAHTGGGTTATLLGTGKVLVTGLTSVYPYTVSVTTGALLYDFSTNSYATTGSMNTARSGDSATLLPNGQVLVAGGYNNMMGVLASAELYTP